jgi:hypothetical protein
VKPTKVQEISDGIFIFRLVALQGTNRDSSTEAVKDPNFKGAFSKTLTGALYLNQLNHNATMFKICREPYMTLPIVVYVQKDFYLLNEINEKILLFQAFGLIEHWHSESVDSKFLNVEEATTLKALNVHHLWGTFQTWICGCFVGSLVFGGELLVWRRRRLEGFSVDC